MDRFLLCPGAAGQRAQKICVSKYPPPSWHNGRLKRSPLCNNLKHVAFSSCPKVGKTTPFFQVAMFRWFFLSIRIPLARRFSQLRSGAMGCFSSTFNGLSLGIGRLSLSFSRAGVGGVKLSSTSLEEQRFCFFLISMTYGKNQQRLLNLHDIWEPKVNLWFLGAPSLVFATFTNSPRQGCGKSCCRTKLGPPHDKFIIKPRFPLREL